MMSMSVYRHRFWSVSADGALFWFSRLERDPWEIFMIFPSCCNVRFFSFRYDFKRSPRFLSFFVDITTICLYIVGIKTIMGLSCAREMKED